MKRAKNRNGIVIPQTKTQTIMQSANPSPTYVTISPQKCVGKRQKLRGKQCPRLPIPGNALGYRLYLRDNPSSRMSHNRSYLHRHKRPGMSPPLQHLRIPEMPPRWLQREQDKGASNPTLRAIIRGGICGVHAFHFTRRIPGVNRPIGP